MDDLSTLGPLALGLLAWGLGLAALMTRRTGLCAPSPVSYTHLRKQHRSLSCAALDTIV